MELQNLFVVTILSLVKSGTANNRIIGGENAKREEFPHQISLQWNYNDGTNRHAHYCAGSVLNENWILTAGHCLMSYGSPGFIEIAAGEYELSNPNENVQRRRIQKAIVHEKFGGGAGPYDIGLIKLRKPLKLGDDVQPVKLPPKDVIPSGMAELSGWGSISNMSRPLYPKILKKVSLPILDTEECKMMLPGQPVHDSNLWAGELDGSKSSCLGDSGGPLIQKNEENGEVIEIGVVSWGHYPCGQRQRPGIFTRVSYFVDWINAHIENDLDE